MNTHDDSKTFDPDNIRCLRGLALARKSGKRVRHVAAESYFCPSSTGGTSGYVVDCAEHTCTCDDHELRGDRCKHQWCVLIVRREIAVPGGFTVEDRKPTYRQKDWSAYTKAQETEKSCSRTLLQTLCAGVEQPPRPPTRGTPPLQLSDLAYGAVWKVYTTLSGRRATTDVRECERDGFIDHAPSYSSIAKFLEGTAARPILTKLVEESARPLIAVESKFAADATGFSTCVYGHWYSHKYGAETRVNQWVKLHALVGTASHVVTSATVTPGTEHDSPHLKGLLSTTQAAGFGMREFSADKGYLSNENLIAAEAMGAEVFVPFKTNSVAGNNSETWKRLLLAFSLHREEFLERYHARSNSESVFSGMKRKFGTSVRSKTQTACENEVLAKCVAWNLSMIAHAIGEFGIDAKFWTPRPSRMVEQAVAS